LTGSREREALVEGPATVPDRGSNVDNRPMHASSKGLSRPRNLYADHHAQDAIGVFALNAEEHPASSNAFDSLAEAYDVGGNTQAARANYEKALVPDPTNEHARTALSQIK
jgi:predicted Zn-dependent protease